MIDTPVKMYGEFDENDPRYQVRVLARRIDQMETDHNKEHEADIEIISNLNGRLAVMEKTYQRGLGAVSVILGLGVLIGFLFSYGKIIFAPWAGKSP